MIERLSNEIDKRFTNWSFVGSIVDWHYLDGQVLIKDFDIVTDEQFEPKQSSRLYGPRTSFTALGRTVDVFAGQPSPTKMQSIEDRLTRISWLIMHGDQSKREKYEDLLDRYDRMLNQSRKSSQTLVPKTASTAHADNKSCPNRSKDPVRTMTCDICSQGRGKEKPVFACNIYGECTHRQVQHGQSVQICIGCKDGPWSFT